MPKTNRTKDGCPIRAEVCQHAAGQPAQGQLAHAQLVVNGKTVRKEFIGPNSASRAQAWVDEWNAHLNKEWDIVRGAAALMMETFVRALLRKGVSETMVNRALEEMNADDEA